MKKKKKKVDDPKSEEKDNATTDTAGAHVEDSTTSQDNTTPGGEANLGALVSETNQATPPTARTAEEILGAHPIDDTFLEKTNRTDVSIDTVNSEEQMTGSHITEFHSPKDEEIAPEDTLSEENQHSDNEHEQQLNNYRQRMASNHEIDHEHQNIIPEHQIR